MAGNRVTMDVVSLDDLVSVWNTNGMPEKRANGGLTEIIAHQTAAGDPRFAGGVSRIVKLLTANGQHIGTVHEVVMPDGSAPHSHPKDYARRDCSRVRVSAEPR